MFKNLFKKKKVEEEPRPKRKSKLEVESYFFDAIEAFENRQFDEAAVMFNVIILAYPDHPLAYLFLGRTYILKKDYSSAIDALFTHLKIQPQSVEAMIYLGLAYYECSNYDRANERFEQALQIRSEGKLARENLAVSLIENSQYEEALIELKILHDQEPNNVSVVELLVLTLGKLKRWDEAKEFSEKLLA